MTLPRCARFGSPWPSAALRSTELTQHFSTSGPDDRVAGGVGRRRVRACQATRRETRRRSHHAETRHVHTRTRHVHSSVTARGHFRGFDSLARRFARLPKYLQPCPAASPRDGTRVETRGQGGSDGTRKSSLSRIGSASGGRVSGRRAMGKLRSKGRKSFRKSPIRFRITLTTLYLDC